MKAKRYAPDVDGNELLIVGKSNGVVSCWTAWKRAISAFNDPSMWEDTSRWGEYFQPHPAGTPWGLCGYGIVVIDMDRKVTWTINDYSTPTSFYLPLDNMQLSDPAQKSLEELLKRPDQWEHVKLQLRHVPSPGQKLISGDFIPHTLSQLIPPNTTPQDALDLITVKRGVLNFDQKEWLVPGGEYAPPGFVHHNDHDRSKGDTLLALLKDMKKGEFPQPDWDNIRAHLDESLDEEDDPDKLEQKYEKLKTSWQNQAAANPAPLTKIASKTAPKAKR